MAALYLSKKVIKQMKKFLLKRSNYVIISTHISQIMGSGVVLVAFIIVTYNLHLIKKVHGWLCPKITRFEDVDELAS